MMPNFELICCVVNNEQGSKVMKIAKQQGVKGGTIFLGRGTIKNKILEMLDLTDTRKEIVFIAAEKELAENALKTIESEMAFKKTHHGIGFSCPMKSVIGIGSNEFSQQEKEDRDIMYNVIFTIVNKGNAENVMDAAKEAGATGGTIINARGSGTKETSILFNMEIEPEKEMVMILAKIDIVENITKAICNEMKIEEPGNGIMFVMNVNDVYGI